MCNLPSKTASGCLRVVRCGDPFGCCSLLPAACSLQLVARLLASIHSSNVVSFSSVSSKSGMGPCRWRHLHDSPAGGSVAPTCRLLTPCCLARAPGLPPPPPAGAAFPKSYTQDLKKAMIDSGKVQPTGCPEYIFY